MSERSGGIGSNRTRQHPSAIAARKSLRRFSLLVGPGAERATARQSGCRAALSTTRLIARHEEPSVGVLRRRRV